RYVVMRILDAIPTLLLVLTLVFLALRLLPGDPALVALGQNATADQLALFRAKLGLDAPLWQQYITFILDVVRLHFGSSYMNNAPIGRLLADNLPYTVELAVAATVVGVLIGMPLGVVSAIRRGQSVDYGSRVFALLGYTVPDFYLGALLLIVLSLNLGLFPINGGGDEGVLDNLYHLVLPALTLGLIMAAFVSRLTRSTLLEVLGRDYVRTARAKGAREGRVIYRHALRNALLPVATGLSLSILSTLSGSVAIEVIFGRPGLGSMLINGIETRDYPVIQADLIVFSIFVVLVNLVMDLLNVFIDPRIRVT
ncbi:MAG TPA: ABC transporter permease, partial [Acetobacteraceae bacterium]|nr:ABC transporter permease [Acetobacteraceae bacterium]